MLDSLKLEKNRKEALAEQLGHTLQGKKQTITTVESCTGGGIAVAITDIAGSSAWINQSWVTYANSAKVELVGVQHETLVNFGAVSEQTVKEMAMGGLTRANADYCIAVSGIAGPTGGSKEKPVGTVWFAIAMTDSVCTFHHVFVGDRKSVREQAIVFALEKLIPLAVTD